MNITDSELSRKGQPSPSWIARGMFGKGMTDFERAIQLDPKIAHLIILRGQGTGERTSGGVRPPVRIRAHPPTRRSGIQVEHRIQPGDPENLSQARIEKPDNPSPGVGADAALPLDQAAQRGT